jgi:hypothetical protein
VIATLRTEEKFCFVIMKCKNLPDEAVIGFTVLGFGRGNRESFELLGLWRYGNLSDDLVDQRRKFIERILNHPAASKLPRKIQNFCGWLSCDKILS